MQGKKPVKTVILGKSVIFPYKICYICHLAILTNLFSSHLLHLLTLLHRRENILKIQSLILNQFQSPAYYLMFKYAWHEQFKGLKEINFSSLDPICQVCENKPALIKCSYEIRNNSLCFDCFFVDYHYH